MTAKQPFKLQKEHSSHGKISTSLHARRSSPEAKPHVSSRSWVTLPIQSYPPFTQGCSSSRGELLPHELQLASRCSSWRGCCRALGTGQWVLLAITAACAILAGCMQEM